MSDDKKLTAPGSTGAVVSGDDDGKLTPEQIQHWRDVLCTMFGPYALMMPNEQVQAVRDKYDRELQARFSR